MTVIVTAAIVAVVAKVAQKAVAMVVAHAQRVAQTQHAVAVVDAAAVVVVNVGLVLKAREHRNANALMRRMQLPWWTATTLPKKTHATSSALTVPHATIAGAVPHVVASATTTQSALKPAHKPASKMPVKCVPKAQRMMTRKAVAQNPVKAVQDAAVGVVVVAMTVVHAPMTAVALWVQTMVKRS